MTVTPGGERDLDQGQYDLQSIFKYESVYGKDFVSPGGADFARELIEQLGLEPGSRALDAGCGRGGAAFLMAREFGLEVDGIDISSNMIDLAREKLKGNGLGHLVSLEQGDCLDLKEEERYDAVYSRDVFLHIHDKDKLFSTLYGALTGGGRLLFTDYCCGEKPWPADFQKYVEDRNYCLHTLDEYVRLIAAAGFVGVVAEDLTGRFTEILQQELETISGLELADGKLASLKESWENKVQRSRSGSHRWGLFSAIKPVS